MSRFYGLCQQKIRSSEYIQLEKNYRSINFYKKINHLQDKAEELHSIDSCEYIWEAGVGFAQSQPRNPILDLHRTELLKLLLTCFSETMYNPPMDLSIIPNKWIQYLTSSENR